MPGLADGETVLALAALDGGEAAGVALGTASGIVKRVQPEYPANRDEFELITLKDDDRVVGAAYLTGDDAELVFITTDAQLLRFPASVGPPAGPPGRRHGGHPPVRRRQRPLVRRGRPPARPAERPSSCTVAGRSGALPGTGGASVKVTPFAEYPPKGRATGGVRCQRFLKGEDGLILAWIGPAPVLAATESGVMVDLSDMQGRRDGSGTALTRQLAQVGQPLPPPLIRPPPANAPRLPTPPACQRPPPANAPRLPTPPGG